MKFNISVLQLNSDNVFIRQFENKNIRVVIDNKTYLEYRVSNYTNYIKVKCDLATDTEIELCDYTVTKAQLFAELSNKKWQRIVINRNTINFISEGVNL